jgi:hypothetical protein
MAHSVFERLEALLEQQDASQAGKVTALYLDVLRKATPLHQALMVWRFEMDVSPRLVAALSSIVEETPDDQGVERYVLAECAHALAVANSDVDRRNQCALALANAALPLGLVERFRWACADLVSGLRLRKEFFQTDEGRAAALIEQCRAKWQDIDRELSLGQGLYAPPPDQTLAPALLDFLLWNLDKGEARGVTSLADPEIRLSHMLEVLLPQEDATALVGEVLDLIVRIPEDDSGDWHNLKCILCFGGALFRLKRFADAGLCYERAMAVDAIPEKHPLWMQTLARWGFCNLVTGDIHMAGHIAGSIDEETARNMSGLVLAYAAEYGRFLVMRKLLLLYQGERIDEQEYERTILGHLGQAAMLVDKDVQDKNGCNRGLYFSALMREVDWMHAEMRALAEEGEDA